MKRAVLLLLVLVAIAPAATAGCGGGTQSDGTQSGGTQSGGTLRMMGNENMAFLEVVNGQPTGFSADLAAEIADRIGRTLRVTIVPFPELFARLDAGECDIAMSAITITSERRQEVAFSAPYFASGQALLVPKGSAIHGTAGLRGKKVGVLRDSVNQEKAESIEGVRLVLPFDAKEPMFAALQAGALDAVICDTPFARYNVKETGKTRIAEVLTTGDQYGIAVKKGDTALVAEIDKALAAIRQDGTYERLYAKYFGK